MFFTPYLKDEEGKPREAEHYKEEEDYEEEYSKGKEIKDII